MAVIGSAIVLLTACSGPEPEPEPEAPPTEIVWASGLESGDLSDFKYTPYNTVVAVPPTVVDDPTLSGDYALAVTIPANATTDDFGARSEVVPEIDNFRPGDDYHFAFSTYLEEGFPTHESWQLIAQWKSEIDGSPPLELDVEDGRYRLAGDEEALADLGPAETGRWVDWVFHVVFSDDSEESSVAVWRDGVQLVEPLSPPGATMYSDDDGVADGYVKFGYYRRSGIEPAGTVYYDELRIGTSYAAVAGTP